MKDETITVTVTIKRANYRNEREVVMEAIDALTYYSCTVPMGQLQPWIKGIEIT